MKFVATLCALVISVSYCQADEQVQSVWTALTGSWISGSIDTDFYYGLKIVATPVPEPSTFALLGVGAVIVAACARRTRAR